jgi:hypothetical protein
MRMALRLIVATRDYSAVPRNYLDYTREKLASFQNGTFRR